MRKLVIFLICTCLLLAVAISDAANDKDKDRDDDDEVKYSEYKQRHKKRTRDPAIEARQFRQWKRRRTLVSKHNQDASLGRSTYRMADNHLADMSEAEWKVNLFGVSLPKEFNRTDEEWIPDDLPTPVARDGRQVTFSFDLRTNPCMPPVKTQSPCGACWAFIATTSVEYQTCMRNNNSAPILLSEQQMIDCSASYGTKGCNGGFYSQAWDYIMVNGGQTTSSSYAYRGTGGPCQFQKDVNPIAGTVSRYVYLAKNETTIMSAVQRGPVTVSIVANQRFVLYSSGIFDDDTCRNGTVNHGVVLVGYGRANGTDYWIARNSWGTAWGQAGHILMRRNVNICRIAEFAFLAT